MKAIATKNLALLLTVFAVSLRTHAQDKIYTYGGRVQTGKVVEIGTRSIRYYAGEYGSGPIYTKGIDAVYSIVYANGRVDYFHARRGTAASNSIINYHENLPEKNTWSFDVFGFIQLTVTQSFEHKLKDGMIGLRVPLYFGFIGGGIAGLGLFHPGTGVYYPFSSLYGQPGGYYSNAPYYQVVGKTRFSFATGLNPKFYLIRHRIIRPFIGPEVDIGYSVINATIYSNSSLYYSSPEVYRAGTVAGLVKFGLALTPVKRFNLTLDGGAGAGDMFGSNNAVGFTGVWQIGLAFGANF
jgi:hypothetical protein